MADLVLFVAIIALWIWVAWVIFRRVGFFGAQKAPRFRVVKGDRVYANPGAHYLVNGILDGRQVIYVFEAEDGEPFVYLPRDKDIRSLEGGDGLESFVFDHCGGDKGLAKMRDSLDRRRKP